MLKMTDNAFEELIKLKELVYFRGGSNMIYKALNDIIEDIEVVNKGNEGED